MDELVRLLTETQSAQEGPRKNAEWQLKQQYANPDFPLGLLHVGAEGGLPLPVRQAALLYLKTFVLACWSEQFDEFTGQLYAHAEKKLQVRHGLLELALSEQGERKIQSAASLVVSKIATADFPDQWPDLMPKLLNVINSGSDAQTQGALRVLLEIVDGCLVEETFFQAARGVVNAVYGVATNDERDAHVRALAVSVFRSTFDTLEMIMDDNKAQVKAFADEALKAWLPLLTTIVKSPLPPAPSHEEEQQESGGPKSYRGRVALKMQTVKVLMRIRTLFPQVLSPHSPELFSATWQELSTLQEQYHTMYILDDRQGRLIDADGLAYTLDFLVLEELDFMQACLRAPPVRRELEQQLQAQTNWVSEVMKVAVAYAQITTEEEGMWDIDVNVFLSEEANVTANYTPRTACGDLVIKLGEWLNSGAVEGLLSYTRSLYSQNTSWKAKEAALYLLNQLLSDFQDVEKQIGAEAATGYVDFIKHAMSEEADFLRARGFLVAGSLTRTSGDALMPVAVSFFEATLAAIGNDTSEVVKVACIRALQYYLTILPPSTTIQLQPTMIGSLHHFVNTQDLGDAADSDDLLITIIETLRDTIMLDVQNGLTSGGVDLLFSVASKGANNFQIALLVTETFEDLASVLSARGPEAYAQLALKVLPSLMGAFDVASMTEEDGLANLAAELLSVLAAEAPSPMPSDFVGTVMPRLNRLLLSSSDEELLKSATSAVKHMVEKDPEQVFGWQDETGKPGLEVVLIIIDRLLNPAVEDSGAAEVGGLAAAVVEKAGSEKLGPYLMQLLRAVAVRLSTAVQAQFIQSLILVFARLSLISAHEVVSFLAEVQIGSQSGLEVVIGKWLENSINFAGYDEIKQNIIALSRLWELHDPRLANIQVKGDIIMPQSDRIMTRSRARQQPEQHTTIPAQLKIIKVLVEELLAPTSNDAARSAANGLTAAGDDYADDDADGDDWEDDPSDFQDLGTGMSKAQLMAYGADDGPGGSGSRGIDDETQAFLVEFFVKKGQEPGFGEVFAALNPSEQEKLRAMGG
ncbi:hypothetical protein MBLNU230_g2282t1 [Neophaeotheca triangularis]